MMSNSPSPHEERYLALLLGPLDECANYRPKFGGGKRKGKGKDEGISLTEFKILYGKDPFYHWVGLDDDLMFAAHKAAGGMTSIYCQLGHGCESLFQAVVRDSLGLSEEEVAWSYEITKENGSKGRLTLDARIDLENVLSQTLRQNVEAWMTRGAKSLGYQDARIAELRGAIFEVRQGYKSADAKRQNADLRFALNAASENYLPVLSIISTQTSETIIRRYRNSKMLVMTGQISPDDTLSTFAFFRNAVGFELDKFFERNAKTMREHCRTALQKLLTPA